MNRDEKRVVLAVFDALCHQSDRHLNTFLGSETIREMHKLYGKLLYEDYCKNRGIRYEDMTEDDFIDAYENNF